MVAKNKVAAKKKVKSQGVEKAHIHLDLIIPKEGKNLKMNVSVEGKLINISALIATAIDKHPPIKKAMEDAIRAVNMKNSLNSLAEEVIEKLNHNTTKKTVKKSTKKSK